MLMRLAQRSLRCGETAGQQGNPCFLLGLRRLLCSHARLRQSPLPTMMNRLLLCFLLLVACFAEGDEAVPKRPTQAAPSSAAITKGQRIFAAHHSYFIQVPPILTEIATAGGFGDQVIVGTKYIGGSKALYHW